MSNQKVLAIDVGAKKCGWAFYDGNEITSASFLTLSFDNFYAVVDRLVTSWNPTIIVCGKPNRMYNVIACQEKYIGICCLIAERGNIPCLELNDMTVRAKCFPGQGGKKKEEIQLLTGIPDPDQSDAFVLAKGAFLMDLEF